jgi:hypothetical protein
MVSAADNSFTVIVREYLSKLEAPLTTALQKLVRYQYPKEVYALAFEVFSDSFTSQFPARVFFMDRSNTEYFLYENNVAKYPSPIDPEILKVEYVYPEELEEEFTAKDPELDPWSIATTEFIAWFYSCWTKAGGKNFPFVATIAHHDSSREFNLKTGQWQKSHAQFNP